MQNQITNQLLLFGIQPGEYQITTHPTGEIEITMRGNTVAVIPTTGRKVIQLNRGWTLDRIPGDSLILAVSAVVAALLRCRHTERVLDVPVLPSPPYVMVEPLTSPSGVCGWAAFTPDGHSIFEAEMDGKSKVNRYLNNLGYRPSSQIDGKWELPAPRTPAPRALALPTLSLSMVENTSPPCGGEVAIPRLGIYPTDNHSPEDYE